LLVLELLVVVLDPGTTSPQLLPAAVPPRDGSAQRGLETAGPVPLRQGPCPQLGAGVVGEAVPGMGAGLELVEEPFEVPLPVAPHLLDAVAEADRKSTRLNS